MDATTANVIIAAFSGGGLCYLGWRQSELIKQQNNLVIFDQRYKVYEIFKSLINELAGFNFFDKNRTDDDINRECYSIILKMKTETSAKRILFDEKTNELINTTIEKISGKIIDLLAAKAKFNGSSVENRLSSFNESLVEYNNMVEILEEICKILEKKLYIGNL